MEKVSKGAFRGPDARREAGNFQQAQKTSIEGHSLFLFY